MALLNVKLQDVSTEGPPQLEPGVYDLLSTKVQVHPAEGAKSATIEVAFRPVDAEEGDSRMVTKYFSLSEKAKVYFKRWLEATGRSDLASAVELDTADLVGLVAKTVIQDESYVSDGETRTKAAIKKFIKPEAE